MKRGENNEEKEANIHYIGLLSWIRFLLQVYCLWRNGYNDDGNKGGGK